MRVHELGFQVSFPRGFVFGQLLGQPGYDIVANTSNIDLRQAQQTRHRIAALLSIWFVALPTHVFARDPKLGIIFRCRIEESKERQLGRQYFTVESYVVWDDDSFQGTAHRFWTSDPPRLPSYSELVTLEPIWPVEVPFAEETAFVARQLDTEEERILQIIHSLLSSEEAVIIPSQGSDNDLNIARAIHLLFPSTIRRYLSFAIGTPNANSTVTRMCFTPAATVDGEKRSWRPDSLRLVPQYAEQIELFLEHCSSAQGLSELVTTIWALEPRFTGTWRGLGRDLASQLWDRIGLRIISQMLEAGKNVGLASACAGLRSDYGSDRDRRNVMRFVCEGLRKRAKGNIDIRAQLSDSAGCIATSSATRAISMGIIKQTWGTEPHLVLDLCHTLIAEQGFSEEAKWMQYTMPLLNELVDSGQVIQRAAQWLRARTITLEQFLELCDLERPPEFYEIVFDLVNESIIPADPHNFSRLAGEHASLRELRDVLLEGPEMKEIPVAAEVVRMAQQSSSAFEKLILLLGRISERMSRVPSTRVLRFIDSLLRSTHTPSLSVESREVLLRSLHVASMRYSDPDMTRLLLNLGKHIGLDSDVVLRTLGQAARLKYYIDLVKPDVGLRQKYLAEMAALVADADTSLDELPEEDLTLLTIILANYGKAAEAWRVREHRFAALGRCVENPSVADTFHGQKVAARRVELHCSACDQAVSESERRIRCPKCRRIFHETCWNRAGARCRMHNCSGSTRSHLSPLKGVARITREG